MKSKKVSFKSIDEYIGTFPENVQKIMGQLRATIQAAAPEADEKISYNMPTFTLNGIYLVYFAGWKSHIAFYGAPRGNPEFKEDVSPYKIRSGYAAISVRPANASRLDLKNCKIQSG